MNNNNNVRSNKNKRKGYCTKCHYTVYIGEGFVEGQKLNHFDCFEVLSDLSIKRHLNPRIHNLIGEASRKKVVKMLEGSELTW